MYDVIVFGVTGVVGYECASYLERSTKLRWAIAGRSKKKLQAASSQLGDVDYIVADVADYQSLIALCSQARVLVTTVGPYELYGECVIRACIEAKCNYVDITGEVPWVSNMKRLYGLEAEEKNLHILSFCGYDSIPSDLSVMLAADALKDTDGPLFVESFHYVSGGGLPPGTMKTMMLGLRKALGRQKEQEDSKSDSSSEGVVPKTEIPHLRNSLSVLSFLPNWSTQAKMVTAPHMMCTVNTPVVHASAARLGYGGLTYRERLVPSERASRSILTGYGVLTSLFLIAQYLLGFVLALTGALPKVMSYLQAASAYLSVRGHTRVVVEASKGTGTATSRARVIMSYPGDAGIVFTALLACESAIALCEEDQEKLGPGTARVKSCCSATFLHPSLVGMVTPAVALGQALPDRLRRAGVHLNVERPAK